MWKPIYISLRRADIWLTSITQPTSIGFYSWLINKLKHLTPILSVTKIQLCLQFGYRSAFPSLFVDSFFFVWLFWCIFERFGGFYVTLLLILSDHHLMWTQHNLGAQSLVSDKSHFSRTEQRMLNMLIIRGHNTIYQGSKFTFHFNTEVFHLW